jgi:hypothetical protein
VFSPNFSLSLLARPPANTHNGVAPPVSAAYVTALNDAITTANAAACIPELDVNAILVEAAQCCCLVLVLPWYLFFVF